jgi:hypothetical protein
MIDFTQLALFSAAAFVLAITPGPGIFYVAARPSREAALKERPPALAQDWAAWSMSSLVLASAELFTALLRSEAVQ